MNAPIRRALLLDAFYQVLDNKTFRLLLTMVLFLIAFTFLVGFREDRLDLLYGWKTVSYDDLFRSFGTTAEGLDSVQGTAIKALQSMVVDFVGGTLGVMFSLAATAFFVPNMLEKGSADILFSKPVSRVRLLLSRYFAGLLFVAILSVLLVGGMYAGLSIVSGYHDPGFLWSALTLVYLFALVHSVSTLTGVVTRSTVAAILISLVFFVGTGCVHKIWLGRSYAHEADVAKLLSEQAASETETEEAPAEDPDGPFFVRLLVTTFDVLHYTLPKTTDADYVSRKLLKTLTGSTPELVDTDGALTVEDPPEGHERAWTGGAALDLASSPARWTAKDDGGREVSRIALVRRSREVPLEDGRTRRVTVRKAADAFRDRAREESPDARIAEDRRAIDDIAAVSFSWRDASGHDRRAVLFAYGDWMFELDADADPGHALDAGAFGAFLDAFSWKREAGSMSLDEWYASRFDWDAELRFNVFFSIGSSLLFVAVVLAIGCWKLSRIDF